MVKGCNKAIQCNGGLASSEPRATDKHGLGNMHAYVYCEFGVCLAGKFAVPNFARAPALNNTAFGSPLSSQSYLLLVKTFRSSLEKRIVGTQASTPLVPGPLPGSAGPPGAEAAWARHLHAVSAPRGSLGNGGVGGCANFCA